MPLNIEGSGIVRGLVDPTADSDAARKKFVEDKIAEGVPFASLDDINDVNVFDAFDGDVLTYFDGEDAYWGAAPVIPPPSSLGDLSDVNLSEVEPGDTLVYFDGEDPEWRTAKPAAGARGGGVDEVFWENDIEITESYTIREGKNAMTAGPVEILPGADVDIPVGSVWTIV
jgi:hypothetical protein